QRFAGTLLGQQLPQEAVAGAAATEIEAAKSRARRQPLPRAEAEAAGHEMRGHAKQIIQAEPHTLRVFNRTAHETLVEIAAGNSFRRFAEEVGSLRPGLEQLFVEPPLHRAMAADVVVLLLPRAALHDRIEEAIARPGVEG